VWLKLSTRRRAEPGIHGVFRVLGNVFGNNASFLVHFSLGIFFSGMRKFHPMSLLG
jgi:hypothetical protein